MIFCGKLHFFSICTEKKNHALWSTRYRNIQLQRGLTFYHGDCNGILDVKLSCNYGNAALSELIERSILAHEIMSSILCRSLFLNGLDKTPNVSVVQLGSWRSNSFRNHKAVQNVMREKSPSSSAPCHFVASTLRSISRESLRNLGQCSLVLHATTSQQYQRRGMLEEKSRCSGPVIFSVFRYFAIFASKMKLF